MDLIQEFKNFFEQFQLDFPKLVAIFAVCLVVFIFSARELACWFFKTQGLRKDQNNLSDKIDRLEQLIQQMNSTPTPPPDMPLTLQKPVLQFPIQTDQKSNLPPEEWMNRPLS